jgi:hypothetical protein
MSDLDKKTFSKLKFGGKIYMIICLCVYFNIRPDSINSIIIRFIKNEKTEKLRKKLINDLKLMAKSKSARGTSHTHIIYDRETKQLTDFVKKEISKILSNNPDNNVVDTMKNNWKEYYLTYSINGEKFINELKKYAKNISDSSINTLIENLSNTKSKIEDLLNDNKINLKRNFFINNFKIQQNQLNEYFHYQFNKNQIELLDSSETEEQEDETEDILQSIKNFSISD